MRKVHLKIALMVLNLMMMSFIVILTRRHTLKIPGWTRSFFQSDTSPAMDSLINFLETSGKPTLTLREVCAIESAALHNPEFKVQLYSIAPFQLHQSSSAYMHTLSLIANVDLIVMQVSEILRNTPLSIWYESGQLQNSTFPVHHLSDATRLALLWKFGGIYLDLDMIVLRSLADLSSNTLGLQGVEDVANGAMAFDKHSPFLMSCMTTFAREYRPDQWGFNGPTLVTNMLKQACNVSMLLDIINKPERCQGIRLLPTHLFLPFSWRGWKAILMDNATKFDLSESYMVHLYSALSSLTMTRPKSNTLMDLLAKENCPETYRWMLANDEL